MNNFFDWYIPFVKRNFIHARIVSLSLARKEIFFSLFGLAHHQHNHCFDIWNEHNELGIPFLNFNNSLSVLFHDHLLTNLFLIVNTDCVPGSQPCPCFIYVSLKSLLWCPSLLASSCITSLNIMLSTFWPSM